MTFNKQLINIHKIYDTFNFMAKNVMLVIRIEKDIKFYVATREAPNFIERPKFHALREIVKIY